MASVTLSHVFKIYDKNVVAVDNACLEIKDHEFMVFVGPSGCGKSTTLRMIAGLESISKGTVKIGDRVVNNLGPAERDIAMVFQNYALYPHMSVYKNMATGLLWRKYPKDEIHKRVSEAARILGLEEYLERKPSQLSGGQRQRVAVGRAIVRKPQVFLFDEPLSNLDAKFRVQMRQEISKLHTTLNTTMIYVTHDQMEAMTMGDRIVVMKHGIVQQVADPITLYNKPDNKFVAGFIGTPPMSFLNGRVEEQDGRLWFREGMINIPLPEDKAQVVRNTELENNEIVMGIRPENFFDPVDIHQENTFHPIEAKVEIVEPTGSETILYLTTDANSFTARVTPETTTEVNDHKKLLLNVDKVHLFNPKSELVIR
ncbi:MAG: ABC transporter ATP-binding protein [Sumerlaeia bacterium]